MYFEFRYVLAGAFVTLNRAHFNPFCQEMIEYTNFISIQVISNAQVRSPILTLGSTTFSHVKHENIYLVAITKSNANAALVFEFLYRLVALGKGYFGKFDEEAVKNNFVLVYELLDGELDFPRTTCIY
jgi:ABC-type uncharacterized transport system permease subunit